MIERFLYTAMRNGLDAITAEPLLLEDIFDWLYELDAAEVVAIKAWFAAKPPNLYHGYAPPSFELPFYSIVLASEGKSEDFIGDDAGMVSDEDDPDYQRDAETEFWDHEYQILCYSEHPDITRYMYEIVKKIMLSAHEYFIGKQVWNIDLSGGDLAPDQVHMPPNLFVRVLKFSCSSELLQITRGSRIGKAFRVAGIHVVDSSESIDDVGGVEAMVTPYIDGD